MLNVMDSVKFAAIGGLVVLALGLIGFALASAWYNDDACTIEQYQCELGALGFNTGFVLIPLGVAVLLLSGLAAAILRLRR